MTNSQRHLQGGSSPQARPVNRSLQSIAPKTPSPTLNSQHAIQDVYIAVMGITGSGKSTFVGICSQQNAKIGTEAYLVSQRKPSFLNWFTDQKKRYSLVTKVVQEYTFMLQSSIRVHLLDTPGFDNGERDDFKTLSEVAKYLRDIYGKRILLRGIIHMHNIKGRIRRSGSLSLDMFHELCGPDFQNRVVLLTTMWDTVTPEEGALGEEDLRKLYKGSIIVRESQMQRFPQQEGQKRALEILSGLVQRHNNAPVQIQRELAQGRSLEDTGAGGVIKADLLQQESKHRSEKERMKKSFEHAMETQDNQNAARFWQLQRAADGRERMVQRKLDKMQRENLQFKDEVQESAQALED